MQNRVGLICTVLTDCLDNHCVYFVSTKFQSVTGQAAEKEENNKLLR